MSVQALNGMLRKRIVQGAREGMDVTNPLSFDVRVRWPSDGARSGAIAVALNPKT